MQYTWNDSDLRDGLTLLRQISAIATAVYVHTDNVTYEVIARLIRAAEAIAQNGLMELSTIETRMQIAGWVGRVTSALGLEMELKSPTHFKPFDLRDLLSEVSPGYLDQETRKQGINPDFQKWSFQDHQRFLSLLRSAQEEFVLSSAAYSPGSQEVLNAANSIEVILRSAVYVSVHRGEEKPDWRYFSSRINTGIGAYGARIAF